MKIQIIKYKDVCAVSILSDDKIGKYIFDQNKLIER